MNRLDGFTFDVAVIGAGHAGIEAALACARLGVRTLCFATHLDAVGNMPCNPAIGGTAKGQLVREIDALGGEMGKAADQTCIQYRLLNRTKGPAVRSLRAQADRRRYQEHMKTVLETQPGLWLRQSEVVDIGLDSVGAVCSVTTATGLTYAVRAVVVAAGTFLRSRILTGEFIREAGPDGLTRADALSDTLRRLGLDLQRFKTGTPPRILRAGVDFSLLTVQPGEEDTPPFSFGTETRAPNRAVCWLTHTTPQTHDIIRRNLHRSPLFAGVIQGVGTRYCPSIEDKIVRFADKPRHSLFLEPMGLHTEELYIQGLSSSLPEDVQLAVIHSIPGLAGAHMTRCGYAIEYDCLDPLCLTPALAVRHVPGLFAAGQVCGSSGYEEAAAQGLMAGINAAHFLLERPPFMLERSSSYIGTLIDDLVTKGTPEPYRMMTSRSEYRLLLRQDNADRRLMPLGHQLGLISADRYERMCTKYRQVDEEIQRLRRTTLPPSAKREALLVSRGSSAVEGGISLADLVRRPELGYAALAEVDGKRPCLAPDVCEQVEISLRYEGYIQRQLRQVAAMRKLERRRLPEHLDYLSLEGLRLEARQKLQKFRPGSLGQASRISGVSPADLTALLLALEQRGGAPHAG